MKITALGICPPPAAQGNPAVTPELLASSLARYSRSNAGLETILRSIDWNDPDRSVDTIFRFIDYGHTSIAGMTGGIPIVIDGCSMFLAYKIFEFSQLCDGQESSTRYIRLDSSILSDPLDIGIPGHCISQWKDFAELAFLCYKETYSILDTTVRNNPSIVKIPANADEKIINRIRRNYALDRARYFIPFASKTNIACIMTARVWAETIKQLDSLPLPEARLCARGLRKELQKFTPRLLKHSYPDKASISQARYWIEDAVASLKTNGIPSRPLMDEVYVCIENTSPPFFTNNHKLDRSFEGKENRYSITGQGVKRIFVRASWNNMAIAELRDLNRHRSGHRFSPLIPVGFYLPPGISHHRSTELIDKANNITSLLLKSDETAPLYVYTLLFGTQVYFEHSTHLDKFIYEIELRTGVGAHFRYAEHLTAAYHRLTEIMPELKPFIQLGTAEPE